MHPSLTSLLHKLMYRILDIWLILCPYLHINIVYECPLALKSIFVNEFFIIFKKLLCVNGNFLRENLTVTAVFLICQQKYSAYLKMERKKYILFLDQTIFLIQTICIIVIFSYSQKKNLFQITLMHQRIKIRAFRTDTKLRLLTKIDFNVMHLVSLCKFFWQKLQIRGSRDLQNSVLYPASIWALQQQEILIRIFLQIFSSISKFSRPKSIRHIFTT